MRLEVIKHRRISLKVPSNPLMGEENNGVNDGKTSTNGGTNGLRERRKIQQKLRIDNDTTGVHTDHPAHWPMASPFSAGGEWRRRALEGQRAAEEVNRWISSGDLGPLEGMVLAGRADLLLGPDYRENFIFAHIRSKQFLALLPEYKEKHEQFLEAIVSGDEETIRTLIGYSKLPLVQCRHPRTHSSTVHLAAIFEHPTIIQILLDKDPTLLDSRDSEGRTALHYAAAFAGILRSEGQTTEHPNPQIPLECFDVLLDAGANESLVDMEGYTPMNFHRSPQLLDIRQIRGLNKFPIRPGDQVDKLIAERDVKALRQIVLAGEYSAQIEGRIFPLECRDLAPMLAHLQMRIRAIHEAIHDDDQLTLKQLVDDWDTAVGRDEHGRTPLHLAVLHSRPRIARYLLLLFPKCVDMVDKANRSPLHYASCLTDEHQRAQMTRILCRAGAESAANATQKGNAERNLNAQNEEEGNFGGEKPPIFLMDRRQNGRRSSEEDLVEGEEAMDLGWRRGGGGNGLEGRQGDGGEEDPFSEGDDAVDSEVERRLLDIDFGRKQYSQLEKLHAEGLTQEIWRVVKKHLGNEKLVKYIYGYRQAQSRLGQTFAAIEANDMRRLKSLLDEEIVQARDIRGLAPLHVAVLKERHEMVEQIAQQFPVQINIADHLGRTAAHYAAPQQNAIYETLADAGADVQIADKNGFSAERYRQNPEQMVQPLPFLLNAQNADGGTRNGLLGTLHSMRNPSFEDSSTLFDPDAPSDEQVRRWLAIGDVQQLEQIVLEGRAHLLAEKSSTNIGSAEFLQGIGQYQSKIDSIHKAVEEGDVRRVKSLIDRSLLATARDRHGMTPLHKALLYGQTNTVRFLLAKYPHCVNEPDHAGRTALHYAAADANGEHMIKVLQKAGGDAFIEDKYGHTPFYYRTHGKRLNIRTLKDNAVSTGIVINQLISGQLNRPLLQDLEEDITDWVHTGNIGKLEELILNGYADLLLGRNHQLEDAEAISFLEVLPQYQAKIQAIHKAIEQGNLRAVKLLTDRKKLALCRDSRGLAPLHKAVVFGQTEIAKYLIRNYPQSVNAMDQSKRTPLHYAASLRDGGYMYKLMRKAGADPNIFDCNGRPPKYYLKYPGELNLERMRLDTKQTLKQILHNRVAPSYLESNIQQWLREGNLAKLDQLVMSGCGDLLMDKKSANPDAQLFLRELATLMGTIEQIHRAVKEGRLETVKQLMTTKRLALARDRHGCTPLHTAIIHEQTEIIRFIAATFSPVLNAPDYNKRTAMHYAAAARDGGHYLKILGKAGADPMAVDNEGRTPDYYRRNAVFDLKMMKERDAEELGAEALLAQSGLGQMHGGGGHVDFENGLMDSPVESAGDLSGRSSGVDSGRRGGDEEEDFDKSRFERLLHERLDMPTSDNGLYLARTVAPVLTKALAEILLRRPANPIGFISDWLVRYMEEGEDF